MIGRLAQFWGLIRELDLGRIRSDLRRLPMLDLRGAEGSGRHTLANRLLGQELSAQSAQVLALSADPPTRADVVLVVLDGRAESSIESRHATIDLARQAPTLVVFTHADEVIDPSVREAADAEATTAAGVHAVWVDARDATAVRATVGAALLDLEPDLALGLGRRAPALRDRIASQLIHETSRVNAEFALMTNLPAIIPFAGGIVGDAADLLVLTKNQAMLVYKLGGLYGRELDDVRGFVLEIAPVVGGAFLWRTLARSAAGLLPPILGAVPKTAIAYVGTYVVGEMARYYYEEGVRPPADVIASFRTEGMRHYTSLARVLRRGDDHKGHG